MALIGLAAATPLLVVAAIHDWRSREIPVAYFIGAMATGTAANILAGTLSTIDAQAALALAAVAGLGFVANALPLGDGLAALTLGVAGGTLAIPSLLAGALAGGPLALAFRKHPDGVPYVVALTVGAIATVATVALLPVLS